MKSFLKQLLIIELPILIAAAILVGIFLYERYNHRLNPAPKTVVEERQDEQPSEKVKILLDQNAKIVEAYGHIYGQKERLEAENLQLKEEIQRLKTQLDIFNKAQLESLKNQLDR